MLVGGKVSHDNTAGVSDSGSKGKDEAPRMQHKKKPLYAALQYSRINQSAPKAILVHSCGVGWWPFAMTCCHDPLADIYIFKTFAKYDA